MYCYILLLIDIRFHSYISTHFLLLSSYNYLNYQWQVLWCLSWNLNDQEMGKYLEINYKIKVDKNVIR